MLAAAAGNDLGLLRWGTGRNDGVVRARFSRLLHWFSIRRSGAWLRVGRPPHPPSAAGRGWTGAMIDDMCRFLVKLLQASHGCPKPLLGFLANSVRLQRVRFIARGTRTLLRFIARATRSPCQIRERRKVELATPRQ